MNIIQARVFDWSGNLSRRKYVFRVPDYASIKKDTLLAAEKNGGKDGTQIVRAATDSAEVTDEVLDMIMDGKKVISSILGVYELKMLKPEEPEEPKPENKELKPCPFCGKSVAKFTNIRELRDCINSEECICKDLEQSCREFPTIVCDYNSGGCGASTGYCESEEEAIKSWNTRAEVEE